MEFIEAPGGVLKPAGFEVPGVLYSVYPKETVFDDNWLLDYQKINNLKQYKLVVIDFSQEHYGPGGIDYVYHALESADINFLLLSHEPSDHKKFDRMLFYPSWYHWGRKYFILGDTTVVKKYKWSCLNGNPRPHRIYNYYYSRQQSYFDSAYFTFYNDTPFRHDDVTLSTDVLEFWENIKGTLQPRDVIDYNAARCDSRCDLPAITESYVQLVSETTVIPRMFVSEKTWKPIASGQLFLMFGNPGIVQYLRNQGVDVFDDIIDHSYDSVNDWQQRLQLAHQQLKQLIDQDLEDIYSATHARRQANVEKFFSGAFDQQYLQTIIQCINTLS